MFEMQESEVAQIIKEIIEGQIMSHADSKVTIVVTLESDLDSDIGATEIDKVQIITKIEREFNVSVPLIDRPHDFKTVADIVKYVKRYYRTTG